MAVSWMHRTPPGKAPIPSWVVCAVLFAVTCNLLLLWNVELQGLAIHQSSRLASSVVVTSDDDDSLEQSTTAEPQSVTSTSSPTDTINKRTTSFLTIKDLEGSHGAYAASWWQSVERFRRTPVHKISWLEDAVWKAIDLHAGRDLRLTRDWLDLSVEHLSKWWRMTKVNKFDASHNRLIGNLYEYIRQSNSTIIEEEEDSPDHPWKDTISVVAYLPVEPHSRRMQPVDVVVLGSQLASLIRHNTGRVVVVTDNDDLNYTETHVWPYVMQLLRQDPSLASTFHNNATAWGQHVQQNPILPRLEIPEVTIGSTELTLLGVQSKYLKTKNPKLVPRACLILLHDAMFRRHLSNSSQEQQSLVLGAGGVERWKYVYYTEQDSPLHTRVEAFPALKGVLDQGGVLTPHRWSPVPHAHDWIGDDTTIATTPSDMPPNRYLPAAGNWTNITVLEAASSCCDRGDDSRDGRLMYPKGNNFWYLDGFGKPLPEDQDVDQAMVKRMERFSTYQLLRLKDGTGLTLAGSESSRQCAPYRNHVEGCSS